MNPVWILAAAFATIILAGTTAAWLHDQLEARLQDGDT